MRGRGRTRLLRRYWPRLAVVGVLGTVLVVLAPWAGSAPAQTVGLNACTSAQTLSGSAFEIDGNLIVNNPPCIDWLNQGTDIFRTGVLISPSTNFVFTQGASENDANPAIKIGNGPPKDGLTHFGVYPETEPASAEPPSVGAQRFLELLFAKIPSTGTTDVDFELNKNFCSTATPAFCSSNGVTPNRTVGDKLITYDFANGGSTPPSIFIYTWNGSTWTQPGTQIGGVGGNGDAVGASNSVAIPNGQDGTNPSLGGGSGLSPNAFGEAAINYNAIFTGGACGSFGSVYTKARSSTSFGSSLKNMIIPVQVTISSCPTITTSATQTATAGQSISDSATLGNVASGASGTITFKAYTNSSCTAPAAFTSSAISVNGPGTYSSGNFTGAPAGTYTWQASYSGDNSGDSPFSICGASDASETSVVSKAAPNVSTTLSPSSGSITAGGSASDSATVTGGDAPTGGVTFAVYSNSSCTTKATTGTGGQIDAQPTTVAGTTNSSSVTFQQAGTYYWQATIAADANNSQQSSLCGSEQINVGKATPNVSTGLSTSSITVGGSASDTATVSGGAAPSGGTVTFKVYTDSSCSVSSLATTGPSGQINAQPTTLTGTTNSSSVIFQQVGTGTYYWQATYGGDNNNNTASSQCTSEQLTVNKATPKLVTGATLSATIPSPISDNATLSGASANAGGSITWKAYTTSDCSGTAAFTSSAVSVNGNGTYGPVSFSPTTPGTYNWVAAYTPDANNTAFSTKCGDPNESTTVIGTPKSSLAKGARDDTTNATGSFATTISANAGDTIEYQIVYTNNGNGPATVTSLSDPVPATTTYVNGSCAGGPAGTTCGASGATVSWTLGNSTVPAGGSVTVSFKVTLASTFTSNTPQVTNVAQVCTSQESSCTNSPTVTVNVNAPPKSSLAKGARDDTTNANGSFATAISANPGDTIEYQIVYTNNGSGPATVTSLSDPVPATTTYVNGSCAGGPAGTTCGASGATVSWTLGNSTVPAGGSVTVSFKVTLASTFTTNSPQVTNVAQVCTSQESSCTNSPPVIITVNTAPKSSLAKGALDVTKGGMTFSTSVLANPGDTIEYQIVYTNNGSGPATITSLSDPVPATTTYVNGSCAGGPAGTTCGASGGTVSWTLGNPTVQPGATVTVTFEVTLPSTFTANMAMITNVAQVCTSQESSCTNSPTVTVTVNAPPQSSLAKGARDDTTNATGSFATAISANPGDTIEYQIVYTNNGSGPATVTSLSDPVPASTTFVSCSGGPVGTTCGASGATVSWTLGNSSVPAGGSVTVSFKVTLASTFTTNSPQVTNVAQACTSQEAPTCATSPPVIVTVNAPPKSSLSKAARDDTTNPTGSFSPPAGPITANPGDTIEYQITYTNNGTGPATPTSLTDPLPASTSYVAASCTGGPAGTTCSVNSGIVSWTFPSGTMVQPGGTFTVSFKVTLATTFSANSTPVSNVAQVCTSQESTCTTTPPVIITVNAPPKSMLTKAARDDTTNPTGSFATMISGNPGDVIEYQVTYTNNGTGPATITSLTDPIPANTTFVSCSGGGGTCSNSGGTVTWNLSPNSIPAGGTVTVSFKVALNSVFPSGTTPVTNVAQACTSQETPSCTPSNMVTVTVTAAPKLGIVKSASASHGNPGDQITYTLAYTNTGNANATGTKITEQIPAGTQFVSCTGTCTPDTPSSPTETWSLGTVNAGGSGSVTLTVSVLNSVGCTIANTAMISSPDENGNVAVSSNPVTLTSTPGPNPAGAHASGSAYGASVNAVLGLINLPPIPTAASSQTGVGANGTGNTALPINLLGTISLNVLSASSRANITNSPAQADDTSIGELATVNILGGVITADVVRGQAEATANGSGSSISAAGTTITNLKIGGVSYANVTPNEIINLPLGLGYVVVDEQIGSTSAPAAGQLSGGTYAADLTVNALDVHVNSLLDVAQIIVGHAVAHADFPQITQCTATGAATQSVSGHAFIASETTTPSLIPIISGFVGIPASGGSASQQIATVNLPGSGTIVQGNVAQTSSTGTVGPTSSTSTSIASVGDGKKANSVSVLGGLITAKLLISQANSTATATGASSNATGTQFLGLTVAGVPVTLPVAPNTVIPLLGLGYVVLNEQIPEAPSPGHTGLTVRAIDVHVTLANTLGLNIGADVIVDEAHSDATFIAP